MGLKAGASLGVVGSTGVVGAGTTGLVGAGTTGVEGGGVAATGVGVGKAEGEAAGACASAMTITMKRQDKTQSLVKEAIFVELLSSSMKNRCLYTDLRGPNFLK